MQPVDFVWDFSEAFSRREDDETALRCLFIALRADGVVVQLGWRCWGSNEERKKKWFIFFSFLIVWVKITVINGGTMGGWKARKWRLGKMVRQSKLHMDCWQWLLVSFWLKYTSWIIYVYNPFTSKKVHLSVYFILCLVKWNIMKKKINKKFI